MKSVVFCSPGQAALQDEPMPACDDDQLLLRTRYSALTNGSERNKLLGGNYSRGFPAKAGYQRVSRVVACGSRVRGFSPGDLVYTGTKLGHVEYHLAKEDDLMIKLPPQADLEAIALLGVASVALHAVRRADLQASDRVLVIGAGLIGLLAAQTAAALGASVTLVDVDPRRLALARALGLTQTFAGTPEGLPPELARQAPFTLALECSGAPLLDALIGTTWGEGLLAPKGRLVLVAGRDRVSYNFNAAQHRQIAVLHTDHFTQEDLEQMATLTLSRRVQLRPLITELVPIDQAPAIYQRLVNAPGSLLGTVFRW